MAFEMVPPITEQLSEEEHSVVETKPLYGGGQIQETVRQNGRKHPALLQSSEGKGVEGRCARGPMVLLQAAIFPVGVHRITFVERR